MSTLKDQVRDIGPIVHLQFGPTRQRAASLAKVGQPVPKPVTIPGLIDTGAEVSTLDHILDWRTESRLSRCDHGAHVHDPARGRETRLLRGPCRLGRGSA